MSQSMHQSPTLSILRVSGMDRIRFSNPDHKKEIAEFDVSSVGYGLEINQLDDANSIYRGVMCLTGKCIGDAYSMFDDILKFFGANTFTEMKKGNVTIAHGSVVRETVSPSTAAGEFETYSGYNNDALVGTAVVSMDPPLAFLLLAKTAAFGNGNGRFYSE